MPGNDQSIVKLSLPLEFQQEIFKELRSEDELLVLARGLGLLRLVTNLLHSYDAVGNDLIILVGADDRENGWIGEALAEHAAVSESPNAKGLTLVNSEALSIPARQKLYSKGGVISVTSQILILDLLQKGVDPASITGMVILHADRVTATSTEAFILRVYRQQNQSGFLKAFSDNPEPFCTGFSPLTTMMRNLFLRKPSLYPRFHVAVTKSLEGPKRVEVIEVAVPMTESMTAIQHAVLDIVSSCISELRRGSKQLDLEDFTPEMILQSDFDRIIRRQLEPNWHRLSFKTKKTTGDLTVLRNILQNLPNLDAVQFLRYLDVVHATAKPPSNTRFGVDATWLLLPAAETLFDTARRRVYTGKINSETSDVGSTQPVLEEQPKWAALADVLEDIEKEVYFNPPMRDDSNGTILIMCSDTSTCAQLREYLQKMHIQVDAPNTPKLNGDASDEDEPTPSAGYMMRQRLRNYFSWRINYQEVRNLLSSEDANPNKIDGKDTKITSATRGRAPANKRRRVRGASSTAALARNSNSMHNAGDRDAHLKSLIAKIGSSEPKDEQISNQFIDALDDDGEEAFGLYDMDDVVLIHPYDGDLDEHVLEEVKPRYVIMYEPDPAFVRRIEVYRSSHTDRKVRAYFMFYEHSVEQQRFIQSVRREKDAFTKLIKERASMVIALDTAASQTPEESFLRTVNTRIAGGGRVAATQVPPRVVFDTRELKSSLPSLLHARSMQLDPCVLTVGDYILTPDICVERKSVSDLIGSLNNGRLYEQAERMLRYYKSPMLLIEFSQNKSFTLEPFSDLLTNSSSAAARDAMADAPDLKGKIVMLTLAFPKLRIIWSSDPYQTAMIFEELKKNAEEPDIEKAKKIGLEDGMGDGGERIYNHTVMDMLREVPGITEANISQISLEVESLSELAEMKEDDIQPLVGRVAAKKIRWFFDKRMGDDAPTSSATL